VKARKEKDRVKELQSMIKQLNGKIKLLLSNGMPNNKKSYRIFQKSENQKALKKRILALGYPPNMKLR
jgi:hypothetical protein